VICRNKDSWIGRLFLWHKINGWYDYEGTFPNKDQLLFTPLLHERILIEYVDAKARGSQLLGLALSFGNVKMKCSAEPAARVILAIVVIGGFLVLPMRENCNVVDVFQKRKGFDGAADCVNRTCNRHLNSGDKMLDVSHGVSKCFGIANIVRPMPRVKAIHFQRL
jgi:hypothetical protein